MLPSQIKFLPLILLNCGNSEPAPVEEPVAAPTPIESEPEEPAPMPPTLLRPPPEGFVALSDVIPNVYLDIRYHTADNFTGAPLPGYGAAGAWLLEEPATALSRVQEELAELGFGLLVYDAYRPFRGTSAMVAWAERTDRVHLLEDGYIARRSGHNRGNTIDLTIATLGSGEPIDMGTPWDTLSEASHTRRAEGEVLKNRLLLLETMEKHGFRHYSKEWWHFRYAVEGTEARDVPYGCFEPDEGAWRAPEGWNKPGYEPKMAESIPSCD